MDLSDISPAAVLGDRMATIRSEFAVHVLRKTLDMEAAQGVALVQMMAQSAGVGTNVDISG